MNVELLTGDRQIPLYGRVSHLDGDGIELIRRGIEALDRSYLTAHTVETVSTVAPGIDHAHKPAIDKRFLNFGLGFLGLAVHRSVEVLGKYDFLPIAPFLGTFISCEILD